ncbi:MAG: hypothetical protein BroJett040_12710 [Oligoflexia bacterium]|nr:MAG: hypothetical protein BroJett040_12710 [Oligoflexia bacterium]
MKMLLIGHRGVGKTALVQRLQIYHSLRGSSIAVHDLDREIEKGAQAKIADIFELVGEKTFRQIELKTLEYLMRRSEFIISLGAGFDLTQIQIHPDVEIVWVSRKTDSLGRIFLDRPRLNQNLTPLEEFQERYQKRSELYSRFAHWHYEMPEGLTSPNEIEKMIFLNQVDDAGGILTLTAAHLQNAEIFKNYYFSRGFDQYELRDDLLTEVEFQKALTLIPKNQILISCRTQPTKTILQKMNAEGYETDWALELGTPDQIKPTIISLHERGEKSISDLLNDLESNGKNRHLKLAIEIHNYSELRQCLSWQSQDPKNRSFLPRSKSGRWTWVRLWLKHQQKLNFIHDFGSPHLDQPTLSEWLNISSCHQEFAAVLGHPVMHSYSPAEHQPYFRSRGIPFFAIDISEHEWDESLPLLEKMGLRYAAVTSPLKIKAFHFAKDHTEIAQKLQSANTLVLESNHGWWAHNTDLEGLSSLLETESDLGEVVIWGGGGTLPVIHELIPSAISYSSRTGQMRGEDADEAPTANPETLIWAAAPNAELPKHNWTPKRVIDLNYRDDSRAKEYCQITGAKYISGLLMFKSQAQAQRQFWERF